MLQGTSVKLLLISFGIIWLVTAVAVQSVWAIAYIALHLATTGVLAWSIHSAESESRVKVPVEKSTSDSSSDDSVKP